MKEELPTAACTQHLAKSGPALTGHLYVSDYFDSDKLLIIYASLTRNTM